MFGPVAPTEGALSPLGLDAVEPAPDGFLGRWQRLTDSATLPHCIANLESSGALRNLRQVADGSGGRFTGMWFADSDVYKTLEALAWSAGRTDEAALRAFGKHTAALLAAAQDDDGYLDSYMQLVNPDNRWHDLRWGHELYCAGHLIQAAVAAARGGTGGPIVEVATRLADLLVRRFGPDGQPGICGHPEIETALVELFRLTGTRDYLDLAARMIELRGHGMLASRAGGQDVADRNFDLTYFQDHQPPREAEAATGHAVRQLYLEAGVVDVAVETGDADLLAASERLWDDLFATKTYLTGAHGSRHRDESIGDAYELPADRAYAETCAAVASFQWNWRLLLATGRHRYADEMERVLYNGIAVSTGQDGRHFFYANPLHLRDGHDGRDEDAPSGRLSWYRCACCPPNLARLLTSISGYLATTDASGVQLHQYTPGTVRAEHARLQVRGDYPWDGRIEITVDSTTSWTLALRIPGWCTDPSATVDGEPVAMDAADGYLRILRTWQPGTTVALDLPMPARVITAHPRVDAVRGCVALARGPLVYCLEQADLDDGLTPDDLRLDLSVPPVPRRLNVLDVPVVLTAQATALRTDRDLYAVSPEPPDGPGDPIEVTAIPYFRWANRSPGAMRVWLPTT
ncbi:MAG TPA: beta-L-arabinofuranosidase domain-containing protein [Pseudonocardiaceae bacterium]|nr:beta-L-arabinofuranosidase domain-containing protein [Pseudonocardiaceae bacterium]